MCTLTELNTIDPTVTHITVSNNCGNENTASALHFARFSRLKELTIGDNCYMYVDQLNLVAFPFLRKVVIGMNSFTKQKSGYARNPNRHFTVKNCPKMKELIVGRYSFSDYASAVVENLGALEVLEVGDLYHLSYNYYYASLELMSGW